MVKKGLLILMMMSILAACGKTPTVETTSGKTPTAAQTSDVSSEEEISDTEESKINEVKEKKEEPEQVEQTWQAEITNELCTPAQLEGVWLLTSGETEGDVWEAQPGTLESMTFKNVGRQEVTELVASCEKREYDGTIGDTYYDVGTTILEEPLYSSCGNEEWSVLVGEYSKLNEDGYPLNTETFVTLLDENTMLRKLYYSFGGGPGVSYQTFKRILPDNDDGEIDKTLLEGVEYECVGYTDSNGVAMTCPPELEELYVYLGKYEQCIVSWRDQESNAQRAYSGRWILGDGNVINLISRDYEGSVEFTDSYWFAGAIKSVLREHTDKNQDDTEMYLYYKGGILKLKYRFDSKGETEDGDFSEYKQSMDYLTENVFSAPEDTQLIVYGDEFLDMEMYGYLPFYDISTSEKSRKILISVITDHTNLWYIDRDGWICWENTANAGTSMILQVDLPEEANETLGFEINNEEYFYEISKASIDLDGYIYIMKP